MSKDVVIAGVIVAACLGLITVAFVVPRHSSSSTELAGTNPTTPSDPFTSTTPSDPFTSTTPSDPYTSTTPGDPFTNPGDTASNPFGQSHTFPPLDPPRTAPADPFPQTDLPPVGPTDTPPTRPEISETKTHIVAPGETLGEISQKYYQTARKWKEIAKANNVDPNELKVGQKLTIPALAMETPATTSTPTVDLAAGQTSYTVKKGDSYYSIAKRELGNAARWKELEKLNGISAYDLRPGKTIKLPARESAVTPVGEGTSAPIDGKVHVVKSGETLSDISKEHYGTTRKWREIVKANPGIDPEGLRVGQKLKLPDIAGVSPTSGTSGTSPATTGMVGTYTVKSGDILEEIAERELGKRSAWKQIVDANPGLDPRKLRVGQKLVIPGKSAPAPVTPPPSSTGFDFGESTPPSTPSDSGFGTGFPESTSPSGTDPFGDSGYPAPPSSTPPGGGSAFPEPGTLPESFGGSSGFGSSNP